MVRASEADEARALLQEVLVEDEQGDYGWDEIANASNLEGRGRRGPRGYGLIGAYARIWAWSFGAMVLAFAVFMLLRLS